LAAVSGAKSGQRPLPTAILWDTQSAFVDEADLADRTHWRIVHISSGDNAEYSFRGDVVLEGQHVTTVLLSRKGRVSIYSNADLSQKRVELVPLRLKAGPSRITNCTILQNTGDETVLEVSFCGEGAEDNSSAIFSFGSKGIVGIKPAEDMKGMSLLSPLEYGVVPSFIGDDLIFDAGEYPSIDALHVPCDSLFLGLLRGCNDMLVVTWPEGKQQMRLVPSDGQEDGLIESVDIDNDGKSVYLALLHEPGIWHKEELKPSYLEKDVAISWKRPFPAKWKTQFLEDGARTTFRFRESKQDIWRAAIGYYTYPVWFEGQRAYCRLGKKIPPKGDCLIYCLETRGVSGLPGSPVDILMHTLDEETYDRRLALPSRASLDLLRPGSHIDPDDLARHAARGSCPVSTCAVTQRIKSIFEAGKELERREYVRASTEDMVYFVAQHRRRIERYMSFAYDMMEFLKQKGTSKPNLRSFVSEMGRIVQEIPQEHNKLKESIRNLEYADRLSRQTEALTREKHPRNLVAFLDLGEKWRAVGAAQDDLVREFHTTTRRLFQEAGYGCIGLPGAVEIADEIRRRCVECLSNPSTYEIWPDY